MACRIALHKPLERMRRKIMAETRCHSSRPHCQMGFKSGDADDELKTVLGIQGAAIGYCQGLINPLSESTPESHTAYFSKQLQEIAAPFYKSHELLITLKPEKMPIGEYVQRAVAPLLKEGRVPILITDYDPAKDSEEILEIFNSPSPIRDDESILVRMVLNRQESLDLIATLINEKVAVAKETHKMPKWWPLLQTGKDFPVDYLHNLHDLVGSNWEYVALATHPFSLNVAEEFSYNTIVAQWLVGKHKGIYPNGDISLHTLGCIGEGEASYNLFEYGRTIKELELNPTSILCGGSMPYWTEEQNLHRLRQYIPLFNEAIKEIWKVSKAQANVFLEMAA